MPLGSSTATLEMDIEAAYKKARDSGESSSADATVIIQTLATDMANAIHSYMLTALVTTTIESDTQQSDTLGGTTTSKGKGVGTGGLV